MGLFNGKNKDGNLKIQMKHYSGLPNVRTTQPLHLILDSENQIITIKEAFVKNGKEFSLPLTKITATGNISEEIIKEKSGTGRAIAGGLLFGTTGAIVGAVTAKDKKKTIYHKVINYISNNEEKSLVLATGGDINEMKFFKKLSSIISSQNSGTLENAEPIEL